MSKKRWDWPPILYLAPYEFRAATAPSVVRVPDDLGEIMATIKRIPVLLLPDEVDEVVAELADMWDVSGEKLKRELVPLRFVREENGRALYATHGSPGVWVHLDERGWPHVG